MAIQDATNLSTMLDRLVVELNTLTEKTDELQAEISPLVSDASPTDARASRALQSLDVISQHLAVLTQYSKVMSQAVPRSVTIDSVGLTESIGIETLAARLSGREPVTSNTDKSAGDCDFF